MSPTVLALPALLRHGMPIIPALAISIALTAASYGLMLVVLRRFGITI